MQLPNFLIVGAQKCGTSTLSNDLNAYPSIFIPHSKEVSALRSDFVLSNRGRRAYASYYRKANNNQIFGDASTVYSKWPDIEGVPARAKAVLGDDLKIIYIVRDPVERIKSHYKHAYSGNYIEPDIDEAVTSYDIFLNYSKYATQLKQWLACFPPENIAVVHFESYVSDRKTISNELAKFLGESEHEIGELGSIKNRAEDRRYVPSLLARFAKGDMYKSYIKPHLSPRLVGYIKWALTRPAALPHSDLSNGGVKWLENQLESDQRALAELLGQDYMSWGAYTWRGGAILRPSGKPQSL